MEAKVSRQHKIHKKRVENLNDSSRVRQLPPPFNLIPSSRPHLFQFVAFIRIRLQLDPGGQELDDVEHCHRRVELPSIQ